MLFVKDVDSLLVGLTQTESGDMVAAYAYVYANPADGGAGANALRKELAKPVDADSTMLEVGDALVYAPGIGEPLLRKQVDIGALHAVRGEEAKRVMDAIRNNQLPCTLSTRESRRLA